ncbi:hypothetical protein ACFQU9_36530 [Actinomadura namibiensis]|uniref:Uncharacterized protein n=1 Tax=Actinomadura namibiensis TaxID=182080 RepID=A0A7W3LWJ2_ACTNM|nr:hypothetical protein [Actinomadura namibiensis]MBA8955562.1 hypothetical protein [Actinomadura namibiensis]
MSTPEDDANRQAADEAAPGWGVTPPPPPPWAAPAADPGRPGEAPAPTPPPPPTWASGPDAGGDDAGTETVDDTADDADDAAGSVPPPPPPTWNETPAENPAEAPADQGQTQVVPTRKPTPPPTPPMDATMVDGHPPVDATMVDGQPPVDATMVDGQPPVQSAPQPFSPPPPVQQPWEVSAPPPPPPADGGHKPFSPPPPVQQPWEVGAPAAPQPAPNDGGHRPFSPPPPVQQPWEVAPHAAQPAPTPAPAPALPGQEPWLNPKAKKEKKSKAPGAGGGGGKARMALIGVGAFVALGAVAGAAAFFLTGSEKPEGGDTRQARIADDMFGLGPQSRFDTIEQAFNDAAVAGKTVVAAGTEYGGPRNRARFLTSADGGRTWTLGSVTADGGQPSGSAPKLVTGAAGAWLALGGSPERMLTWTSKDSRSWTEHAVAPGAFVKGDVVEQAARTADGWIAVGHTQAGRRPGPVVWRSNDGANWERLGDGKLSLPVQDGRPEQALHVVSGNGTLVMQGTVVVTKENKGKKSDVTVDGFWRSTDGGRIWDQVTVPQADGSAGLARGLAFDGGRFLVLRQNPRGGHGVLVASQDGGSWARADRITAPGNARFDRFTGGERGVAALATAGGRMLLFQNGGEGWRRTDLGKTAGRFVAAVTPTGTGTSLVAGAVKGPDRNFYLGLSDGSGQVQEIDLTKVPDAVNPDRTVRGLAAADGGRVLALGGTSGDAAVWYSADGATSWHRAGGNALGGPGRQLLLDAANAPAGWLAVGDDAGRALVATSQNGDNWQRVTDRLFIASKGVAVRTAAVTAGRRGYVVVGSATKNEQQSAIVWTSPDGRRWARSDTGDLRGVGGAWRWMADVASGPSGYLAVGAIADPAGERGRQSRPAVWVSGDGGRWSVQKLPVPQGATHGNLVRVAVRDSTAVALGAAFRADGSSMAFAVRSTDGGRSWTPAELPGQDPKGEVHGPALNVVATAKGFAAVGTSGKAADHDVRMWSSADGSSWQVTEPQGAGLSGSGAQQVLGLVESGGTVTGTGLTTSAAGDSTTLWRFPAP